MSEPSGWTQATLGKECSIEIGGTPSRGVDAYWDTDGSTENAWVSIKDMRSRVIIGTAERISDLGVRHSNAKLQPEGTVLLSFKLTIGRVAFAGMPLYTNEAIAGLQSKTLDSEFLYHGLQQWNLLHGVDQAIKGATLNKAKLKKINFVCPTSRTEQSKIAEVLSTVDRAIAQTEALIAKQQRIKTGLMQDLLTRGIDQHGQLRSEATHAFKDSSLGRIPVEWEVTALEEVADVSGGKRLPAGHSYAEGKTGFVYLRVLDFYNREIDVDSLVSLEGDTFQTLQRYEIRDGELCISIAGSLGYVSVLRLRTDMRAILTENALRIVPGSEIDADYLCMAMNGLAVQTQVEALKGTGGGVPKLALHRVKSLSVAFPKDKMEQERIIGIMTAHAKNALKVNKTLHKLQRLKTALMQDLLTGKVRVTPLLQAAEETVSA